LFEVGLKDVYPSVILLKTPMDSTTKSIFWSQRMNTFENSRKHVGMPVQAVPVERHIAGAAAISGDVGIEASLSRQELEAMAKTHPAFAEKLAQQL
jgi:hypothetical protein